MELKEFVRDYKDLFKWSGVEKMSNMTPSSLRQFASGHRGLSDDNFNKVRDFFKDYGIALEYNSDTVSRKKSIAVRDLVPIEGWRRIAGSVYSKDGMFGVLEGGVIRITKV